MTEHKNNAPVYIIGAGPGAPDLMTLRALRAIRKSDVLICDRLLPRSFFEQIGVSPDGKEFLWRGEDKELKNQDKINELMLGSARQGRTVARVKTGDPHIFGRGMEELEFLTARGVKCEVIPGLTAATAFSSLTDLPLTYREDRDSFAIVTARGSGGTVKKDFPNADSLVIFMGVSVIKDVVDKLTDSGWPPDTPAAMLERLSMPWQKQSGGTLEDIARLSKQEDIEAPAILVIGKAAGEDKILPRRPRILFTGLNPGNFRALGRILHWPAIRATKNESDCQKLPATVADLAEGIFSYTVFTSRTSVRMFFDEIANLRQDCRILSGTGVVACGAGTAGTLADFGINADIIPSGMGSDGIVSAVNGRKRGNVLLLQSATATEALAGRLAAKLGNITRLCLHKVVPHPELGKPLPPHDVIYFTCPSGARAFWKKYGNDAFDSEVWSIGEVTRKQLSEYGVISKVVGA